MVIKQPPYALPHWAQPYELIKMPRISRTVK